jgi:hypothetical protein
MDDKTKFLKVYSTIPLGLRNEIVVVLADLGPISWQVAYIEIYNETETGAIILGKLKELELI